MRPLSILVWKAIETAGGGSPPPEDLAIAEPVISETSSVEEEISDEDLEETTQTILKERRDGDAIMETKENAEVKETEQQPAQIRITTEEQPSPTEEALEAFTVYNRDTGRSVCFLVSFFLKEKGCL